MLPYVNCGVVTYRQLLIFFFPSIKVQAIRLYYVAVLLTTIIVTEFNSLSLLQTAFPLEAVSKKGATTPFFWSDTTAYSPGLWCNSTSLPLSIRHAAFGRYVPSMLSKLVSATLTDGSRREIAASFFRLLCFQWHRVASQGRTRCLSGAIFPWCKSTLPLPMMTSHGADKHCQLYANVL